jgi:adenylate kinase
MLNLIIIGPQGSGKGTQAENILSEYHLIHIESGALIRARAKLHDKKAEIIDHLANKKGQLLPDGIVLDMITDEIMENKNGAGFLFDGFPRTVNQYQAMLQLFSSEDLLLTAVLYLSISDDEAIKRLQSRRICMVCGKSSSILSDANNRLCNCGGKLIIRPDDNRDAILKRLNLFHANTEPVLSMMEKDGVLIKINGEKQVEKIFLDIKQQLEKIIH